MSLFGFCFLVIGQCCVDWGITIVWVSNQVFTNQPGLVGSTQKKSELACLTLTLVLLQVNLFYNLCLKSCDSAYHKPTNAESSILYFF